MFTIIATDGRQWTLRREAAATIYAERGETYEYHDRYVFAMRNPKFLDAAVTSFTWKELSGFAQEIPAAPPVSWRIE